MNNLFSVKDQVVVITGAMAFTRMPSPNFVATSLAMNAVKLEIPAFAAA